MGGFAEDRGKVRTVEIYRVRTNTWRQGPPLPIALDHPMAAALEGRVYLFGGYRKSGAESARAFVLRDGGWRRLPNMPAPRAAGGAATARGRLYVVGGTTGEGLGRKTFVYNPNKRRWSLRKGLRMPRQHMGVASYRGFVYGVAGRIKGLSTNLDAAERFNPRRNVWRRIRPVPTARGGLDAAATRNGFIVAAGGEEPGRTFDEVEAYNTATRRWRSLPPLPTPRHGLGVVAVGRRLFVVAGGTEPGLSYSGANEMLNLADL